MTKIKLRQHLSLPLIVLSLLLSSAASAQQTEVPIACTEGNEPQSLSFGSHTTACEVLPATDLDRFEFCADAGDVVRLVVNSAGNFMDPHLVVRDPSIQVVLDESCNDGCSMIHDLPIVETGCHTIFMSDLNNATTGTYTLQIERIVPPDPDAQLLGYDDPVSDAIDPMTDHDEYRFYGTASTEIRLVVASPSNFMDPTVEIRDPNGSLILDGVVDGASCLDGCSFAVNMSLSDTGFYSLFIFDRNAVSTGDYVINFWCLSGDCDSDADGTPDDKGTLLSYVTPQENTISPSVDVDAFRFNATTGTELRLTVNSSGNFMDPTVEIRDPDGTLILDGVVDGASCNDGCSFSIPVTPQTDGFHSLIMYDRNSITTGDYTVAMWCVSGPCDSDADGVVDGEARVSIDTPAVLSYGVSAFDAIDPQVESDIFIFGGTIGDLVQLNINSPSNFMDPTVEIRDPNGVVILNGAADGATCNNGCSFSEELTFAVTGTYSLMIYDLNNVTAGSYEIGLQCLIGSCTDAVAMCGDNCIDRPNGPLIPDAGGNSQLDADGDGHGNVCDADIDNDGIVNFIDMGLWSNGLFTADAVRDFNGDGSVNFLDFPLYPETIFLPPGPSCSMPIVIVP